MTLETAAKWRGWACLCCLVLVVCFAALAHTTGDMAQNGMAEGVMLLLAIIFGRGWARRRRQMQRLEYQGRQFRKMDIG
jgi:hypothetical protein